MSAASWSSSSRVVVPAERDTGSEALFKVLGGARFPLHKRSAPSAFKGSRATLYVNRLVGK